MIEALLLVATTTITPPILTTELEKQLYFAYSQEKQLASFAKQSYQEQKVLTEFWQEYAATVEKNSTAGMISWEWLVLSAGAGIVLGVVLAK